MDTNLPLPFRVADLAAQVFTRKIGNPDWGPRSTDHEFTKSDRKYVRQAPWNTVSGGFDSASAATFLCPDDVGASHLRLDTETSGVDALSSRRRQVVPLDHIGKPLWLGERESVAIRELDQGRHVQGTRSRKVNNLSEEALEPGRRDDLDHPSG